MIVKIERGSSAEGLLIYQRRLDKSPQEQAAVRLFAKHKIFDVENAASALDRMAKKSGLAHPIVHLILRAERGLSDEEWRVSLDAALEAAHLKGRPYVAFLHDHDEDTEGEHMHVALCVADSNGCPPPRFLRSKSLKRIVTVEEAKALPRGDVRSRSWDSQVQRRLMTAAREIEDRLGLQPLARDRAAQAGERQKQARIGAPARHRQKKDGTTPLLERVDVARVQSALDEDDWDKRTAALLALGLRLAPSHRQDGSVRGLRLELIAEPGIYCPASDLGSRYGKGALDKRSAQSFADWHASVTQDGPAPVAMARAELAEDPLKVGYDLKVAQIAQQRQMIRAERQKLQSWYDEQRRKARAFREARWPQSRDRTQRALRNEVRRTYTHQCAEIKREYAHQRRALDERWPRKPSYVEWLADTAKYDIDAARQLARLTGRTATPAIPQPVPSLPVPPILSGAELAAQAAEQERLIKMQELLAQRATLDTLSKRMESTAIALLDEADRRNRRVTIEKEGILIDGRRLTGIEGQERVTQAAKRIAAEQDRQISELAKLVPLSASLPQRSGIEPRAWVENLIGHRDYTRWLTPQQEVAMRRNWVANKHEAPAIPVPPIPPVVSKDISVSPPPREDRPIAVLTPEKAAPPSPNQPPAVSTALPPQRQQVASPTPMDQAFAMIAAAKAAAPSRSTQPHKVVDEPTPSPKPTVVVPAKAAEPVEVHPPSRPSQTSIIPSVKRPPNDKAELVAAWLMACRAAAEDLTCAQDRDKAAALLIADTAARPFLNLLDTDRLNDLRRQASAHHERHAPAKVAVEAETAAPVAPPVAVKQPAPAARASEEQRRLHLQRQILAAQRGSPRR